MINIAIAPPIPAGDYAGICAALDGNSITGVVLIGHPAADGSFEAEYRPFRDSPHEGWKARYDRDRICTEVISGVPE